MIDKKYGNPVRNIEIEIIPRRGPISFPDQKFTLITKEMDDKAYKEASNLKQVTETDNGYLIKGFTEGLPIEKAILDMEDFTNFSVLYNSETGFDDAMISVHRHHGYFSPIMRTGFVPAYLRIETENSGILEVFRNRDGLYTNQTQHEMIMKRVLAR